MDNEIAILRAYLDTLPDGPVSGEVVDAICALAHGRNDHPLVVSALTPAPEAPKGGEGGGNMWTGMGPNTPAPRLDPNCQCICHSQPGVMHVAACCSTLTLRAGKRYRDGNGEVIGPVWLSSFNFPSFTDGYMIWNPDGTLAGGTRQDKRSLVAEVEDD